MDFSEMLSKTSEMREQMLQRMETVTVEGSSGGGAVIVKMDGRKQLLKLTIAPTAATASASDIEMLEDLIVAAFNDASNKANEAVESSTRNLFSGLGLPGL